MASCWVMLTTLIHERIAQVKLRVARAQIGDQLGGAHLHVLAFAASASSLTRRCCHRRCRYRRSRRKKMSAAGCCVGRNPGVQTLICGSFSSAVCSSSRSCVKTALELVRSARPSPRGGGLDEDGGQRVVHFRLLRLFVAR